MPRANNVKVNFVHMQKVKNSLEIPLSNFIFEMFGSCDPRTPNMEKVDFFYK